MCRNIVNDEISVLYSDNLDIVGRISRDLENENIDMSNKKIVKILNALKQTIKTFYKAYMKKDHSASEDHLEDLSGRLIQQL